MRVLIAGVSGRLGRLVATRLAALGHQVVGLDVADWPQVPSGIELVEMDLLKRPAEDLFRTRKLDAVIHLTTATQRAASREDRCRTNLLGIKRILDFSHRHGVRQVLFVGRHTYYGATPDSALYLTEDEPPLGLSSFPELGEIVAADLYAGSALWRYPEIQTVILRLCFTLGPTAGGTLAAFLGVPRVPTVMGFDPLIQFMHEADAADAIVLSLLRSLRGVFNVAGPTPIPLSVLLRDTGRLAVPVPEPLYRLALGRFGLPHVAEGALSIVKYPIVIDSTAFQRRAEFRHRYDEQSTILDYVKAAPIGLD